MTGSLPLVTIITPTYNRADYLAETIESVLSQDYANIEYIVLDDGSMDNTQEILKPYQDRITCISHTNIGETRTVNKGFQLAKGDILCVVNSDDPLLPGAVNEVVTSFINSAECLVVYTDWDEIGPDSEVICHHILPDYDIENMLTIFNVSMGPGTFFRREVLDKYGYRDEGVKYTGDLEFWFRIAVHNKLFHLPKILATHRTHPESISITDRGPKMADELVRIFEKVYSSVDLPPRVKRIRRKAFSTVHFVASLWCGDNHAEARSHIIKSFKYDPFRFLKLYTPLYIYESVKAKFFNLVKKLFYFCLCILFLLIKLFFNFQHGKKLKAYQANPDQRKFAFVSHVIPPSWSGQAIVIGRLLRGLRPDTYSLITKHKVSVLQDQPANLPGRYFQLKPERQFQTQGAIFYWLNTFLSVLDRGWQIANILLEEKCGQILVGTGDLVDPPAAYLASLLVEAKYYAYLFDDYVYQWTGKTRTLARVFEWIIYHRLERVIVPNEFLSAQMKIRRKIEPIIIRNPCEEVPGSDTSAPRDETTGEIKIVYSGAIYHVNFGAFQNLITALENSNRPEIKLHLYTAQSSDWLATNKITSSHIILHQHVSQAEIVQIQSNAHILFIPFAFDSPVPEIVKTSAPGKLGDYLASGTPILAHVPPDSFVKWYLTKYECGMVVDDDDPKILWNAIDRLLRDHDLRGKILMNALERARVDFDPEESQRRLLQLLGLEK